MTQIAKNSTIRIRLTFYACFVSFLTFLCGTLVKSYWTRNEYNVSNKDANRPNPDNFSRE